MQRQLGCGQLHRFACNRFGHTFHLVDDSTGPNDGDPVLGSALTLSHSRFRRLLGHRLIREDPNPDLAAALHKTRNRDTTGFNLTVCNPAGVENFQTEVSELERRAAPRFAAHASPLLLAVLHFLWHQHKIKPLLSVGPTLGILLPSGSPTS